MQSRSEESELENRKPGDTCGDLPRLRQELDQVRSHHSALVQALNEGYIRGKIVYDESGNAIDFVYKEANSAYGKIAGKAPDKVIGSRVMEAFPDQRQHYQKWIEIFAQTVKTGSPQFIESYVSPGGRFYIVYIYRTSDMEFAAIFTDITELREFEDRFESRENELKLIQKMTQVGSWYHDLQKDEILWSDTLYEILDIEKARATHSVRSFKDLLSQEHFEEFSASLERLKRDKTAFQCELPIVGTGKESKWVWMQLEPDLAGSGKLAGIRGAVQDFSARKENEQELKDAKNQADEANIHKNFFLANMSHEIRTPLNSIIGFTDLLKDGNATDEEKSLYLELIGKNSHQLLSLINDIIDVSRMEADELEIHAEPCSIAELFKELQGTFQSILSLINKQNIRMEYTIPDEHQDLCLMTDPIRLKQVLTNLLNNAIKFTEKGTIRFGFSVGDKRIHFFVEDQGRGIPAEKLEEVFERFKQVNYNENAKYGGTGLGLAICRGLVELLNGTMAVESREGKGSKFTFSLPLLVAESKTPREIAGEVSSDLDKLSLLIVEDDPNTQVFYKPLFRNLGVRATIVDNGRQAIETYSRNKSEFDAILMDIRMPEMDGFEAMEEIHKIDPEARVIMQSAFAMDDQKSRARELGCFDYLTKPISRKALIEVLNRLMSDQAGR